MNKKNKWPKIFPLPHTTEMPQWTGHRFQVGDRLGSILSYEAAVSGQPDDLTTFQDNTIADSRFINISSRSQAISHIAKNMLQPTLAILNIGYML